MISITRRTVNMDTERSKNPIDIEFALKQTKSKNRVEQQIGTNYLIAKFTPLISKLFFNICPDCDFNDMIQSGNLAILKAIKNYNYKSQFSTWVYYKIRYELQKQADIKYPVKVSRYLKNKGKTASFENFREYNLEYNLVDNLDNLENTERYKNLSESIKKLNKKYSTKWCRIFADYFYFDQTLKELSKKYRISATHVIHVIIKDLKKNIDTHYNTHYNNPVEEESIAGSSGTSSAARNPPHKKEAEVNITQTPSNSPSNSPSPQILLITKCCSKGYYQALTLQKALKNAGYNYPITIVKPKNCTKILDKYNVSLMEANKNPYIFIEDLLIKCENLPKGNYINELVIQIQKCKNNKWSDKIENGNGFLNKITKK